MNLQNKRLLIEAKPGLGDTIMTTPALRALKKMFPTLVISMLVRPAAVPLFDRLPFISHVYAYPRGNVCNALRLAYALSRQDIVIFTTWVSLWARFLPYLHIPLRAGFCKEAYKERGYFTKNLHGVGYWGDIWRPFAVKKQIEEALNMEIPLEGAQQNLVISDPTEAEIHSLDRKLHTEGWKGEPFVAIMPFGHSDQNIPLKMVDDILPVFKQHGLVPIISGENPLPPEWQNTLHKKVIDLCGKINLRELIALLDRAKLVFCNDSGHMHIASARQTLNVALFAIDIPARWASNFTIPITAGLSCSATCSRPIALTCPHKKCLTGITKEMVETAVLKALKKIELSS